jgi:hypothetical protein
LEWIDIKAGEFLNDNFQVENIGDPGSSLNWNIKSFPDWGRWSFYPEFGVNLTPENGQLNIQVSVVAPDENNKEFEGYIRVENQNNPEDFELIPVYLKTSKVVSKNWDTIKTTHLSLIFMRIFEKIYKIIKM